MIIDSEETDVGVLSLSTVAGKYVKPLFVPFVPFAMADVGYPT